MAKNKKRKSKQKAPAKPGAFRLQFRQRDEDKKINSIKNLKSDSKLFKSLKGKIYSKGHTVGSIRNLVIRIEGGYSKSQARRREANGIESDEYYYFGFTTSPDKLYDMKTIKAEIAKAMQDFENIVGENSEKYGLVGDSRISRVQVDINYLKENENPI